MKHIEPPIVIAAFLALLSSCLSEPLEPERLPAEGFSGDTVSVSFSVMGNETKSAQWSDTDMIREIAIIAYTDGVYAAGTYSSDLSGLSLSLVKGRTYNLYAVANCGTLSQTLSEDEFIASSAFTINDDSAIQTVMPMSWSRSGVVISSGVKQIDIMLQRLAARITFSVDQSLLDGMTVKTARLMNSALRVMLFPDSDGSRLVESEYAGSGDWASETDLAALNRSEDIVFYALENCQGTLLPQNTDPWQKIPDNLGNVAGLCTYLEVTCEFGPESIYTGEVTYRLYPGRDNCTNFDIRRNSSIGITLVPTMQGLKEISWKVETDLGYRSGFVSGKQSGGPYDITDLYPGVQFRYQVDFSSDLLEHFNGDASGCALMFESPDGGAIKFSPLECTGDRIYTSVGTSFKQGNGTIWLLDGNGERIQSLTSGVRILRPGIILSPSPAEPLTYDEDEEVVINTGDATAYVYLIDRSGNSILNNGYFSFEPFDFDKSLEIFSEFDITGNITGNVSDLNTSCTKPYIGSYIISCDNDGKSHTTNLELAEACGTHGAFEFSITENNLEMTASGWATLLADAVDLEIVDNGWAKYQSSQHTVLVDNPSNLAFELNVIEMFTDNPNNYNAISTNNAIKYVDQNCNLNEIKYLSGSFYTGEKTIYGNLDSFVSERNSYGDRYDEIDGRLAYPLNNVNLNILHNSVLYFKSDNDRMYILMEGRFLRKDGEKLDTKIKVYDHLSDGSMTMDIIYGNDPEYGGGYNHRGIWTYYNGRLQQSKDNVMSTYTNLDLKKLTDLYKRHTANKNLNLIFTYEPSTGYLYVQCSSNPEGVSVDIKYSGTVQGYVETRPNGTWFGKEDNYCSANYSSSTYTVVPTSARKSVGRHIMDGMNAVYAQTFFDSRNAIGSANNYQHCAHPTSATCTVLVRTSSDGDYYPVQISSFSSTAQFYHSQEGVNYSLPLNGSNGGNYTYVNTVEK